MVKYSNKTSIDYHKRQLEKPYESTNQLVDFIKEFIKKDDIKEFLDIACGSGINSIQLSKKFKNIEYLGLDISRESILLGNEYIDKNKLENILLIEGDLYDLQKKIHKKFDASLFIQTLFAIDNPFEALENIITVTKRYLFINSLFTNDNVYIQTKAESLKEKNKHSFNIIPIKMLEDFLKDFNGEIVKIEEVKMSFDIVKNGKELGSYTRTLQNKERILFTSDIYLPWKLVAIKFN